MIEVSNHDNIDHNRKFTIQYTKAELDKIQNDSLEQLSKYFARVNNNSNNIRTEVEIVVPPTIVEE